MKKQPVFILFIATVSLLLILASQAYLVYDYYTTVREGLIRESDAILKDVFRTDMNLRNDKYRYVAGEDTLSIPPPPTKENTIYIDLGQRAIGEENISAQMDVITHIYISKLVPISQAGIDSVAASVLQARNIHSDFIINHIKQSDENNIESQEKSDRKSFFSLSSELLYLDFDKTEALQLTLINPFGLIAKRMALMLFLSLTLCGICVAAFLYLMRVLAKQKQLVSFKNDFLTNIAHELKRPAASIAFNIDCLRLPDFYTNDKQREASIRRTENAVIELNETINMIVTLARSEEGLLTLNKEKIDLPVLLYGLKERFLASASKLVEINILPETEKISCTGDVALLTQCFANLMDNALKYSGDSVRIEIYIRSEDGRICLTVKDNGVGISEDKQAIVFEKYARINNENNVAKGFGIGLNYVKTIVEKHKGQISLSSKPGIGSEFTVILPR